MKVVKKLVSSMIVIAMVATMILINTRDASAISEITNIIYDVEIDGLVDGVVGQTGKDYIENIAVKNNLHYNLTDVDIWGEKEDSSDYIRYSYEDGTYYEDEDFEFKDGYSYCVQIDLEVPEEDWAFAPGELMNVISDNEIPYTSINCEGGVYNMIIFYYFSFNGPINIAQVKGVVTPKSGQTYGEWVNNIASLEEDKYTIESVYLYDHTICGGTMGEDDLFRSGDIYIGSVVLKTTDPYIFASATNFPEEHTYFESSYRRSTDYRYIDLDISFCMPEYGGTLDAPVVSATCNGEKSVKLTWKKVDGATSYQIYKYFPTSGIIQKSKVVTGTSAVFYNLKSGSSYRYIVQAMSEDDVSDNVNVKYAVDAKAGKPASSIITNVSYKYTNNSLKMSWDAVDGVSEYYVYKYWVSSNTLSEPKVVTTNSCKYYNKTPNSLTHARYVISTEKLDPSTFNGKGYVSFVLPATPSEELPLIPDINTELR